MLLPSQLRQALEHLRLEAMQLAPRLLQRLFLFQQFAGEGLGDALHVGVAQIAPRGDAQFVVDEIQQPAREAQVFAAAIRQTAGARGRR